MKKLKAHSLKKPLVAAVMAASIAASILTMYGTIWMPKVEASHFIEVGDASPLLRRPYGYVPLFTGLAHAFPDDTVLFDSVTRLDPAEGDPAPLINPNGATLSSTNVMTAVGNAAQDWMNSAAAGNTEMVDFTSPTQDNTAEASLLPDEWCGFAIPEGPNNRWEIDICNLNQPNLPFPIGIVTRGVVAVSPSMDEAAANGFVDQYIEADMALNTHSIDPNENNVPWASIGEMQGVARHEFGHWYGLGDLYQMWPPQECANAGNEGAQGPPVMCISTSQVQTGDINGLYFLYPELNTFNFPDSFTNNNIDAAVGQINGSANNNADMITLITDRNSAANTNDFRIRPLVDINPNTYARTLGVTETLFTITSGIIKDVGNAIGNVDDAGDNRDMVVGYVDTSGKLKFRTYFDINLVSNNLGWTSVSAEQTISPSTANHYGVDMVLFNVDGDARDEMVIFSTEIVSSVRYLHWWVVNFNNDGTIASTTAFTGNTVQIPDDREIGSGVVDAANRKIAVTYSADKILGPEYVGYTVLVLNSGGAYNSHTDRRVGPIEQTDELGGTLDGFGGDAFASNGIGSANPDLYFIFVENDVEEFYIERDSLWGSHGTSDNSNN